MASVCPRIHWRCRWWPEVAWLPKIAPHVPSIPMHWGRRAGRRVPQPLVVCTGSRASGLAERLDDSLRPPRSSSTSGSGQLSTRRDDHHGLNQPSPRTHDTPLPSGDPGLDRRRAVPPRGARRCTRRGGTARDVGAGDLSAWQRPPRRSDRAVMTGLPRPGDPAGRAEGPRGHVRRDAREVIRRAPIVYEASGSARGGSCRPASVSLTTFAPGRTVGARSSSPHSSRIPIPRPVARASPWPGPRSLPKLRGRRAGTAACPSPDERLDMDCSSSSRPCRRTGRSRHRHHDVHVVVACRSRACCWPSHALGDEREVEIEPDRVRRGMRHDEEGASDVVGAGPISSFNPRASTMSKNVAHDHGPTRPPPPAAPGLDVVPSNTPRAGVAPSPRPRRDRRRPVRTLRAYRDVSDHLRHAVSLPLGTTMLHSFDTSSASQPRRWRRADLDPCYRSQTSGQAKLFVIDATSASRSSFGNANPLSTRRARTPRRHATDAELPRSWISARTCGAGQRTPTSSTVT